jgi:phosphate/sulfate permease
MPGGVTFNGQRIIDEASEEITRLEEEMSLSYELPVDIMIG